MSDKLRVIETCRTSWRGRESWPLGEHVCTLDDNAHAMHVCSCGAQIRALSYVNWSARLTQPWSCDKCGAAGEVPFDESEDAYAVIQRLRDWHAWSSLQCARRYGASFVKIEGRPESTADAVARMHVALDRLVDEMKLTPIGRRVYRSIVWCVVKLDRLVLAARRRRLLRRARHRA